MKTLSWNCRGLGTLRAERALSKLIFNEDPEVAFLMETRKKGSEMKKIGGNMGFKHMFTVDCRGDGQRRGGGLALLWRDDTVVELISYSPNHISSLYKSVDQEPIHITGFYGYPEECNKHKSWQLLREVNGQWMCFGDFNAIISSSEKQGGGACTSGSP